MTGPGYIGGTVPRSPTTTNNVANACPFGSAAAKTCAPERNSFAVPGSTRTTGAFGPIAMRFVPPF